MNTFSGLLFPKENVPVHTLSDTALHDLGMDSIIKKVAEKEEERAYMLKVLSGMTDDPEVIRYRIDIFQDIYEHPEIREKLVGILGKISFLRDFGSFRKNSDEESTVWDLMHRLSEIRDYIRLVEAFYEVLSETPLQSKGLLDLRDYVAGIYEERGFAELRADIEEIHLSAKEVKSLTVGINLNERFEAESIGLVSVNGKHFTKAGVIGRFAKKMGKTEEIAESTEWEKRMHYLEVTPSGTAEAALERVYKASTASSQPFLARSIGMTGVPEGDATKGITHYMGRVTDRMISLTVRKLREVLNRYVTITITDITKLIPEFLYYIRFAEHIEALREKGFRFCKAEILPQEDPRTMEAHGMYNMKLASLNPGMAEEIVPNDLTLRGDSPVCILTGANRGGKTTFTQGIGLLFLLSGGGIFVPGDRFLFKPADRILTHFPADEDKTMDLGRLGEECSRFRELFRESTENSLLLLNETFSTTSFEEGYYIAKDAIRALLLKGVRTVYNTHMHKIAEDCTKEPDPETGRKAVSLVTKTEGTKRSFRIIEAPPEGLSYAEDIAKKYGVTYDMLTE